jgi:LmbE family N-acetylglucosaminyl deacetylase
MRWIYISPHLDDAIYSAGGLIYEQVQAGTPVEIWTIMSKIPERVKLSSYAKAIHQRWVTNSAEESFQVRRAENEKASAILGAQNRYLGFVDSIYRTGEGGHPLYTSSFLRIREEEKDLPRQIAETVSKYLYPDDKLICPLALGGHVDHIIVRKAVGQLGLKPFYMADIPYLLDAPYSLWTTKIGMKKSVYAISKIGLQVWLKAINAYSSQLEMEFKTTEQMEKSMTAYWQKNKGICLWQKR